MEVCHAWHHGWAVLAACRQELLAQIAAFGELHCGSLVELYKACGHQLLVRAARPPRPRPQWILTTKVWGKTRTRAIPPQALAATRAQIAECLRLCAMVAELITVSEQLCAGRVQAQRRGMAPEATTKKLGAQPLSLRTSKNLSAS